MHLNVWLSVAAMAMVVACAPLAEHGPVSEKTQAQMESLALSKTEFMSRMNVPRVKPTAPMMMRMDMALGVPMIKAGIQGGKPLNMLLDSGASRTMVQAQAAVKHRVPLLKAEALSVELRGVVGNEKGRVGLLNPLTIGNWPIAGYPCLVRTYENRWDGPAWFPESVIGFDVALEHCTYLTVDYRRERVTFGFGSHFSEPARGRAASVPYTLEHGVPFVTLKSGKVTWKALVDTGSFNGVEIDEDVALKLGVHRSGTPVQGLHLLSIGGTVTSEQINLRTVRLPDLTFMGGRYPNAEVDISPGPPRVGSGFLKDYKVTFDFKKRRLWLEW